MNLFNSFLVGTLPLVPKAVVRRLSSRYIAGERLSEAFSTIAELNRRNMMATVDILGEFIEAPHEAERNAEQYRGVLRGIQERGLDSNVSLKLTSMGLKIDTELCYRMTRSVIEEAARLGNTVRLDMEDSSCTSDTLQLFQRLRKDFEGVGCVIQSYLRRSEADVAALAREKANVRLCKGIYVEPESIAFKEDEAINESYRSLLRTLLTAGSYVGIATHDEKLVQSAYSLIDELGLGPEQYEFQMLLGVTETLRQQILDRGHRLRVYVPFGVHWYAYSVRRLKENPQLAGYALKGLFSR